MNDIKKLDEGQLDMMWSFLQFRKGNCTKYDVKTLCGHLDNLRQLLIQKTGGRPKYAKSYEKDINDTGTIVNCIVIETMEIYLGGGFEKLAELLTNEHDD